MGEQQYAISHWPDTDELIAKATRLPCFAIGYLHRSRQGTLLRFVRAHGFTIAPRLELPLETRALRREVHALPNPLHGEAEGPALPVGGHVIALLGRSRGQRVEPLQHRLCPPQEPEVRP